MVRVWKVWIGGPADVPLARATLSDDEVSRAAAFVFDLHRNRYLKARLALRQLIAGYLRTPAAAIEFDYSRFGKPDVAAANGKLGLRFNLSHCDDIAVVALTLEDRVGIDIEKVRRLEDMQGLAELCFSANELTVFGNVPDDGKPQAFFNCWTRKESFVKAVGEGLSYPLKDFDVTLRPGEPAALLSLEGSAELARHWSLLDVDLRPLEGWVAAVTVETGDASVEVAGWWGERPAG